MKSKSLFEFQNMIHMVNNLAKAAPKGDKVVKMWENFMGEVHDKDYAIESLIQLPYKEIKELSEDSNNPISALPKLSIVAKKDDLLWDIPMVNVPFGMRESTEFSRFVLDDYILELFK